LFEQESLALAATELVCRLMQEQQLSKSDLSNKLDKSRAYVSQLLSGSRNLTLHTLAELAFHLGYRIEMDAIPLSCVNDNQGLPIRFEFPKAISWDSPLVKHDKDEIDDTRVA
jgi:transcriptional regulator with XRE-family HTH domain